MKLADWFSIRRDGETNRQAIRRITAYFEILLVLGSISTIALAFLAIRRPEHNALLILILAGQNLVFILIQNELKRRGRKLLDERNQALANSEASLRSIFESSRDAICVSFEGAHVMVNPAYLEMFGYSSSEELIGKSIMPLTAPEFRALAAENVRKRAAGEAVPNEYTMRGMRKDGSVFDMELKVSTYLLNDRQHTLAILRDVTNVQRTERELRESEAAYRLMFENNPAPMWVFDTKTLAFLAVNDAAVAHYGYSAAEFLAMKITDIRPPEDVPALIEAVARVGDGYDVPGMWRHIKKDGTLLDVNIASHNLTFNGRPAQVVLVTDVTEQHRAYQALEKERAFLRQVIDAVPGFIFVKDNESRFVLGNRALAEAYHVSVDDLIGKRDADFNPHSNEVENFLHDDREVIEQRRPKFIAEEPVTFTNGELHWLTTIKVPLCDEDGNCSQLLAVATDITARKQAEAEIQRLNKDLEKRVEERTAQLIETIQDLDAFSYSISHDLRAPLRSLSGFADLVLEDTRDVLSPQNQDDLEAIKDSSERMSRMLDGLLAFSRLGRLALKMEQVDVNALVRDVLRDLQTEIDQRSVELRVEDLPPCQGDPSLLRQVWFNLLTNALKFTRQRSPARITVGCQLGEDGRAVYFVRDNGAGFNMQYASKLFGVFQRLHRPEEFEGTGVGLAIVSRILRKHGGTIWAEAEVEQGATFYFSL